MKAREVLTTLKIVSTISWFLIGSYFTIHSIIFLAYLGHDAKASVTSELLSGIIFLVLLWGCLPNMWTKYINEFLGWMISLSLLIVALISTLVVIKQSPYFLELPIKSEVIIVIISYFFFCMRKILPYLKIMKVNKN
ncbi:hypothetical protein FP435_01715 [Lactobacillus sp. PV037]|uniref:hypothetical protein n=1 Tax=unclassified Lactobacillus TaxID=2620435 RepID=UPI00223F0633|nr:MULTISPECIES: hypothetical protein [unclassified Lactobacillus]QNQ82646.1 hypothetical protein FP433_06110 [Lactobacillus sp. PV012]QNQ83240.1 hypothetical protein FP435_01715 [Lactobacillus sp. PV037]